MRKIIATTLVFAIALSFSACGKSEEAKSCQQKIDAIGEDITLSSLQAVIEAGNAYSELSDEDAADVDISKLENAERILLTLEGSPYHACKELMGKMKDPNSFRIYGDIVLSHYLKEGEETEESWVTALTCDAKNGYGAYGGKTKYEVDYFKKLNGLSYFSEKDEGFIGVAQTFAGGTMDMSKAKELGFTFFIISGERMSQIIGCEYYD